MLLEGNGLEMDVINGVADCYLSLLAMMRQFCDVFPFSWGKTSNFYSVDYLFLNIVAKLIVLLWLLSMNLAPGLFADNFPQTHNQYQRLTKAAI